jgi:hypothetical protein
MPLNIRRKAGEVCELKLFFLGCNFTGKWDGSGVCQARLALQPVTNQPGTGGKSTPRQEPQKKPLMVKSLARGKRPFNSTSCPIVCFPVCSSLRDEVHRHSTKRSTGKHSTLTTKMVFVYKLKFAFLD